VLFLCTVISALSLPVNPYPKDNWFGTQYLLFGRFPLVDDYPPIAVPAVLYKLVHWWALLLGTDLRGELYWAVLAQNGLVFCSACLVYATCKYVSAKQVAGVVALLFLLIVLSTGVAQAFWSENVVLPMYALVLYLNMKVYYQGDAHAGQFWRAACASSFLIGLLVITRMTPIFLIPGLFFLFYRRLDMRRLLGYTALSCAMTALLLGAMLVSNQARFGRFELTNSSGRHLWQGVMPIVDEALGESPEFLELKALNSNLHEKNWWEIRLPEGEREEYYGDKMLGRLAKEAIRSHPFLYLRLGLNKFFITIARPIQKLGSDVKGNHPLLSADPLHADRELVSLGEFALKIPSGLPAAGASAVGAIYGASEILYPLTVFFILASYGALITQRARLLPTQTEAQGATSAAAFRDSTAGQWLIGVSLLAMIYYTHAYAGRAVIWAGRLLCAAVLLLQVVIIHRGSQSGTTLTLRSKPWDGVAFTFLGVMFFGTLWFSWQIEVSNTRNVVPLLPFFAQMIAVSLSFWHEGFVEQNRVTV
jgi:hypothetical protein